MILVAAGSIKLGVLLALGVQVTPDSAVYVGMADELLGLEPFGVSFSQVSYWPLYLAYPIFLMPLRGILGDGSAFLAAVGVAQSLFGALAAVVLFRMTLLLTRDSRLASVAALGLAANPEVLAWDRTLLGDSLNLCLLVMATDTIVAELIAPNTGGRLWPRMAVVLVARPTNLVFLSISAIAIFWRGRPAVRYAALLGVLLAAICSGYYGRQNSVPVAQVYFQKAESGVVVNDRPTYDVANSSGSQGERLPQRIWFAARVVAKRAMLFWAPTLEGFSAAHMAVNLMVFVPLLTLAGSRLVAVARGRADVPERYLVALVAGYTVFHACTTIDFDLRYRLPVLPAVHLLAARALAGRAARPA